MYREEQESLMLGTWLTQGWHAFRGDPLPLAGAWVMYTALSLAITLLPLSEEMFGVTLVVGLVFQPVLQVGWCHLCLRRLRGEETWATDIFQAFRFFGVALFTYLLYYVIVIAGLLLLIVPGIIWACKFRPCLFAVMDRRISSPLDAIQLGGAITRGHVGKIFCLGLIYLVPTLLALPFLTGCGIGLVPSDTDTTLMLTGALPYLLSLLVLVPWLGVADAASYERLAAASSAPETSRFPPVVPQPRPRRESDGGPEEGDGSP